MKKLSAKNLIKNNLIIVFMILVIVGLIVGFSIGLKKNDNKNHNNNQNNNTNKYDYISNFSATPLNSAPDNFKSPFSTNPDCRYPAFEIPTQYNVSKLNKISGNSNTKESKYIGYSDFVKTPAGGLQRALNFKISNDKSIISNFVALKQNTSLMINSNGIPITIQAQDVLSYFDFKYLYLVYSINNPNIIYICVSVSSNVNDKNFSISQQNDYTQSYSNANSIFLKYSMVYKDKINDMFWGGSFDFYFQKS